MTYECITLEMKNIEVCPVRLNYYLLFLHFEIAMFLTIFRECHTESKHLEFSYSAPPDNIHIRF